MHPVALEPAAIATALRPVVGPVTAVEPLSGFAANQDFSVRTSDRSFVLKAGRAHGITAEAWACERVRREGVPAPEIVDVDTECGRLPLPFLLMRAVPGAPVEDESDVLVDVGRTLRVLHDISIPGYGFLHDIGAAENTPAGPHSTWLDVLQVPMARLDELISHGIIDESLARRLGVLVDSSGPELTGCSPALLHGDLHPRHIFADSGELTALIDWGDVAIGDPLFDLGRFSRAGDTAVERVLDGYEPEGDRTDISTKIVCYRVLWSLQAIVWEFHASGDWFQSHVDAILDGLDNLDPPLTAR